MSQILLTSVLIHSYVTWQIPKVSKIYQVFYSFINCMIPGTLGSNSQCMSDYITLTSIPECGTIVTYIAVVLRVTKVFNENTLR